MKSPDELRQRVQREKQLAARLCLATKRLEDAQRERIWAIASAHKAGLSIRKISVATGLSPSRIHQLLNDNETLEIPLWLDQLREQGLSSDENQATDRPSPQLHIQAWVAKEIEVLRWCIDWIESLDREEDVIVNLRPDTDTETEFVRFDLPQVLRVLGRIVADLDELTRRLNANEDIAEENPKAWHYRLLAVPKPEPKKLRQREQRVALRNALGLPPFESR